MLHYLRCYFLVIVLFVVKNGLGEEPQLPSSIVKCYRDDPKIADCMRKRIQGINTVFKSGSEELGLEPFDPLLYTNLLFKYKNNILGGSVTIPKAVLKGLSNMKISNLRANVTDKYLVLDYDSELDKLKIDIRPYHLAGNLNSLSVSMDGNIEMELDKVRLTYHLAASVKPVDGQDFLFVDDFRWRFKGEGIQNLKILNSDVVRDRPVLSRIVKTLIQSSWRILKNSLLPGLLPEVEKNLKTRFSKFYRKYPYDVFLPKRPPQNL